MSEAPRQQVAIATFGVAVSRHGFDDPVDLQRLFGRLLDQPPVIGVQRVPHLAQGNATGWAVAAEQVVASLIEADPLRGWIHLPE